MFSGVVCLDPELSDSNAPGFPHSIWESHTTLGTFLGRLYFSLSSLIFSESKTARRQSLTPLANFSLIASLHLSSPPKHSTNLSRISSQSISASLFISFINSSKTSFLPSSFSETSLRSKCDGLVCRYYQVHSVFCLDFVVHRGYQRYNILLKSFIMAMILVLSFAIPSSLSPFVRGELLTLLVLILKHCTVLDVASIRKNS